MRSLICLAMVKNACSTLVALFAEVSRKGIPRLSANSCSRPPSDKVSSSGERPGSYLGNRVLDNLLVRHIALVANEELIDALGRIAVNLLEPLLDVVERFCNR